MASFVGARGDSDAAIQTALTAAATAHDRYFLAKIATLSEQPAALAVIESVARNYGTRATSEGLAELLAEAVKAKPAVAERVIAGFAAGWPSRSTVTLTDVGAKSIGPLMAKLPSASRARLLKLAATWGVKGMDAQLAEITKAAFATLADVNAKDADRLAAAQQIIEFRPDDETAAKALVDAVKTDSSPTLAAGIFEALTESKARGAGALIVAKLKDLPPAVRPAALRIVLQKTDSVTAFLDAVEKGTLRFDMLALDQRTALATHPNRRISARARKILELGGGLPNADRQKVIEELKPILAKTGSIENGKKLFIQHCGKCHKHGTEGTAIGPDLTGFAVHPKEELLIHIIDPSRSVEGNFKAYRVVTLDDRTIIGMVGAQTGTSVEIIDSEAKRHALAKEEIASLKETDKSLMPEGFEKVMKPEELTDLLEFLTQKGRFVPVPLDRVATIVSTKGMFFTEEDTTGRLIFPDWNPKMVGEVPFVLVDPQKDRVKNIVMLYGPQGNIPPKMPKSVSLPYNGKAKAIHILGGVGGWAAPFSNEKTVSMI
ncbi:MAG TPA: c-type cytochrome, partial [Gemmata sp.]|nr:c-type cytochrome [Gemmata sp.]